MLNPITLLYLGGKQQVNQILEDQYREDPEFDFLLGLQ